MDGQQPNFELPTPVHSGLENQASGAAGVPERPAVSLPEVSRGPASQPLSASQIDDTSRPASLPQADTGATVAQQPQQIHSSGVAPAIAGDVDVIEKEWVQRAKRIVDMTREDPYQQNRQLSAYKADYVRKRYNKELKVPEEQAS